ncbi:MAG: heavy-metal-associated domain-containing protein [Betaproteobacteria bacterium]|nr:heavy-metal-associated domain-containing protein [Betaproteobacteria bacterium]
MKKVLIALAVGAASLAALAQTAAPSAAVAAADAGNAGTVKFAVNGMVCAFCAQGIEKRLTKMSETGALYINLAQKVVAVQPKPGKSIDIARVSAEIVEAGYTVTATQPVPQTVAAIRAEMKSR